MNLKLKSIGSDPEMFLIKDGEFKSAIGKIGGSKRNPKSLGGNYFIQEDNVLVEFNIPPAESKDQFISNMETGLRLVKLSLPDGYDVINVASAEMSPNELKSPKAKKFGCDPDYCVWTKQEQVANPPQFNLRTAGGHIHICYENPTENLNELIGKSLDIHLGLPSVLLDSDKRRREVYGGAGSIRHKKYGLEYRTLSSFWIANKTLIAWVYDQVNVALDFVSSGRINEVSEIDGYDVACAINFGDTTLASLLMQKYEVKHPTNTQI